MRTFLPVLLLFSALFAAPRLSAQEQDVPEVATTAAQASDAVSPGADAAFAKLRKDFRNLYLSLMNGGGIKKHDRPVIRAFLERVRAFNGEQKDYAGGIAMEIQLWKWLNEEERLGELYQRLTSLQPDNVKVALAAARHREQEEGVEPDQVTETWRQLRQRFPDDPEVRAAWGEHLRKAGRYDEAIETLRTVDPATEPKAVFTVAQCLFAEQHFAEAAETMGSIPARVLDRETPLRRQVERQLPIFKEYVQLWANEEEIRAAEEAADDLPRVEIHTSKGRILVELFENEAPNTVANFISLCESDFYNQIRFHRYEPDFMIQGGDPNTRPEAEGVPGHGGPGYFIPDEHHDEGVRRNHFRGSLAMANRGGVDTGGSQFYFTHRPTPWLNGKHTVFGRVLDGLDIVRSLRKDDEIVATIVVRKRDHEYEAETIRKDFTEP